MLCKVTHCRMCFNQCQTSSAVTGRWVLLSHAQSTVKATGLMTGRGSSNVANLCAPVLRMSHNFLTKLLDYSILKCCLNSTQDYHALCCVVILNRLHDESYLGAKVVSCLMGKCESGDTSWNTSAIVEQSHYASIQCPPHTTSECLVALTNTTWG